MRKIPSKGKRKKREKLRQKHIKKFILTIVPTREDAIAEIDRLQKAVIENGCTKRMDDEGFTEWILRVSGAMYDSLRMLRIITDIKDVYGMPQEIPDPRNEGATFPSAYEYAVYMYTAERVQTPNTEDETPTVYEHTPFASTHNITREELDEFKCYTGRGGSA